jgi:hypothetical protein
MKKGILTLFMLTPTTSSQISSLNPLTKPSLLACEGSLGFVTLFRGGEFVVLVH